MWQPEILVKRLWDKLEIFLLLPLPFGNLEWMNAGSTFLKYRSILKEEAIEYILVIGSKRDGRPIKMDSEGEREKEKRKP